MTGNLADLLRATADASPTRIATIDIAPGGTEVVYDYRALDRLLGQVAAWLNEVGVQVGDRVAVGMANRTEFIAAAFGAMRMGAVPVLLNIRLGRDALAAILADAAPVAALIDASNAHLPGLLAALPAARRIGIDVPGWPAFSALAVREPLPTRAVAPDHACAQIYTSGTTGAPKGVVLTHGGQLWHTRMHARLYETGLVDQRTLIVAPMFHKNALAGAVKPLLLTGGRIVIMEAFEPRAAIAAIARHRITHSTGVPTNFELMLAQDDLIATLDLASFARIFVGSGPSTPALLARMQAVFGVRVFHMYGSTEAGALLGHRGDGAEPLDSCGGPWPDIELRLIDAEGRDADRGELHARTPAIMAGYHGQPQATVARFVDGWFRTGDVFARDVAGNYTFQGRVDDMFVSGGENIYPLDVEAIVATHPGVAQVCVVAVPHATKGQAPAAMIVARAGFALDHAIIRDHFIASGPAYAHPRATLFVDALPLAGTGKVDRVAVAAAFTAARSGPAG